MFGIHFLYFDIFGCCWLLPLLLLMIIIIIILVAVCVVLNAITKNYIYKCRTHKPNTIQIQCWTKTETEHTCIIISCSSLKRVFWFFSRKKKNLLISFLYLINRRNKFARSVFCVCDFLVKFFFSCKLFSRRPNSSK